MSKKAKLPLAKTPAPKADRLYGSERNPKGSASSTTKAAKIKLGKTTTDVLRDKLQEFKKANPEKRNVTLGDLKAVYRRGSGAYSGTHRPTISGGKPNSRAAWSYARVNAFLRKAAGLEVKKAYIQDDDLLKRGGQINPDEFALVVYHEQSGNWLVQRNKVYVWLYEDLDAAKKLQNDEYDWVMFPPTPSISMAFRRGYVPPLKQIWTKKYQKEHRGSDKLVGIVEGWYDEKNNKLYVLMMTTRKDYRRRGVNSYLITFLRQKFGLEKDQVIFDKPTDEGKLFEASGKYHLGGEILIGEIYSGLKVKNYLKKANYNDTSFFQYIKNSDKYTLKYVDINNIVANDSTLATFISDSGGSFTRNENESEWSNKYPIVIGDDETEKNKVLDGYHRIAQAIENGENELLAFVKIQPYNTGIGYSKGGDTGEKIGNTTFDGSNPDIRYARGGGVGGKKKTDGGDCYFIAGQVAINNKFKTIEHNAFIGTPYVVHAEVRGQGALTGIRYGHAWVEDDLLVYDYSNNREIVLPKQYYYMAGDIKTDDPKKYRRYTFAEALEKMLETGNYGCWDIEVDYATGGETEKTNNMERIQLPDMESDYETLQPILAKQGYELRRVLRATKSVDEIAADFNVPKYYVERELVRGTSVELEHTDRQDVAREIALHHLAESPNYYINLAKIEAEQKPVAEGGGYYKRGGEVNPDDSKIKNAITHKAGSAGGLLVGNRHSEGGIKAINKSTGQPLEMEGGEVVITRNAVSDNKKREFEGEMLTNREILSRINEGGGGVSFARGGDVPHKCSCSGREYRYGGKLMRDNEIVKNIIDTYAGMYDFAGDVVKPPLHYRRYGSGGTITYFDNKIPTLRGFAQAVGVPNVLMLRGRYAEYLKNDYNISIEELPHLLKTALLLGNQKLVDAYTKR